MMAVYLACKGSEQQRWKDETCTHNEDKPKTYLKDRKLVFSISLILYPDSL